MAYSDEVRKAFGLPRLEVEKRNAGGEGLGSDYLSFRNTYWGQMQPVNYELLWRVYLESPEVYGAVNALVDAVVGDGWELKPIERVKDDFSDETKDGSVEKFNVLLKDNEFVTTLRDIVTSMIIFGDAYLELVREDAEHMAFEFDEKQGEDGKKVETLKRAYRMLPGGDEVTLANFDLNAYEKQSRMESRKRSFISKAFRKYSNMYPNGQTAEAGENISTVVPGALKGRVVEFYPRASETIRIDYNEHNEIIKFIQRVKHRRVDFYPDEMIHFPLNKVGNRVYGHASLTSLMFSIQTKFSAEGYTYDYFRRGFMPRTVYVAKNQSQEQVTRMREYLRQVKPQQDVVLVGEVEVKAVAQSNQDMQFKDLLKYLREQIFVALQVPPTLLGLSEGSNRNNSQTQMEMFDRKKKALKHTIEEVLNNKLFTMENFGIDVTFVFKEDNTREELKKAQAFGMLSNSAIVHPNEARAVYGLPKLTDEELKSISELKQSSMPQKQAPNNQKGGVSPEKSGDRMDNAETQNTERQMENKAFKKSDHIDLEIEESKGSRPTTQQGSISRAHSTYNTGEDAIVDRQHSRYPFGAAPMESVNPEIERRTYAIHRVREIVRAQQNAMNPGNSFSLNTDPDDGNPEDPNPPKEGVKPAESNNLPERKANLDPDRDEVNAQGKKVWTANDPSK